MCKRGNIDKKYILSKLSKFNVGYVCIDNYKN